MHDWRFRKGAQGGCPENWRSKKKGLNGSVLATFLRYKYAYEGENIHRVPKWLELQTLLFPKLHEDEPEDSIWQQDGAPLISSRCSLLVERRSSTWMGWLSSLDFLFMVRTIPQPNPLWLPPLELHEGQSVCATATCEHIWFAQQKYSDCGDHHTRNADQSVARIRLPCAVWPRVSTLNACRMCYILLELLFHFCWFCNSVQTS